MTAFTNIPKQVEDVLEKWNRTTSRRNFLKNSGLLVVSFSAATVAGGGPLRAGASPQSAAAPQAAGPYPDPDFRQLDSWIVIHEDSTATFYVGKTDCGQGTGTAFRQMMSDELDIAFNKTSLIMGSTDVTVDQGGSGGSDAIQTDGWPMRRAAAEARRVLLELASKRLGVPVDQLAVSEGVITVKADPSRRVTYGELIGGKRFNVTLTGPTQGLVGYWTFDGPDISGTRAKDSSGLGNHGTLKSSDGNSYPKEITGKVGQALRFNGTTNSVDVGNPSTLQITGSLTVLAWIKLNDFNAGGIDDYIISKGAVPTTLSWLLKGTEDTGPETIAFEFSSDGTSSCSTCGQRYGTTILEKGVWYHVAGVYNSIAQTVNVYVNGVLDDGTLTATVPSGLFNTTSLVCIAAVSAGSNCTDSYNPNGTIDDVRLYNRALNASEVMKLYNMGR